MNLVKRRNKEMRYLILILSMFFVFACATVKKEVVIDVVRLSDSSETIWPHITIEELSKGNWKQINSDPCPSCGFIDFYLSNEDSSMEIQYAIIRYSPSQRAVLGYAYLLEGKIYIFTRDRAEVGGFKLSNQSDASVEIWIGKFKKYFLNENVL